jgi:hypothetical protein
MTQVKFMKTKLIGFLIAVMLITTLLAVAKPPESMTRDTSANKPVSTSYSVDAPVWEIGDQWTYKIDNISIIVNQTDKLSYLYLSIAELPLTVSAVDGTSYTLDVETSVNGHTRINADLGNGPINVSITFTNLKISGSIIINKSTLGIKAFSATLSGRFWVDVIQQQFLPFSLPVLPVKMTMDLISDFSSPVSLLSFPLNTTMAWNSSATNLTLNGEVRSPWFYFISLINNIAKLAQNELLPPEIAALLPVVNIQEALTTLGTGNVFHIPMIPYAFYCLNTETITVPAGTYDAYNITILNGTARCFYAPTAKNVVKLTGNIQDFIPYITNINMELLSADLS